MFQHLFLFHITTKRKNSKVFSPKPFSPSSCAGSGHFPGLATNHAGPTPPPHFTQQKPTRITQVGFGKTAQKTIQFQTAILLFMVFHTFVLLRIFGSCGVIPQPSRQSPNAWSLVLVQFPFLF